MDRCTLRYPKNMESLITQIERVFHGVHPPRKITLQVASAHDDYDYDNDDSHRKGDFIGPWQEIPDAHLEKGVWGLAHLDKDGIHYYLPALMTWVLKNYKSANQLVNFTIYQLAPNREDPNLSSRFDDRFRLLNLEQKSICREFLELILAVDPEGYHIDSTVAKEALESEWQQYK